MEDVISWKDVSNPPELVDPLPIMIRDWNGIGNLKKTSQNILVIGDGWIEPGFMLIQEIDGEDITQFFLFGSYQLVMVDQYDDPPLFWASLPPAKHFGMEN